MMYNDCTVILRGHIQDGMVVLENPNGLPEGTEVEVVPVAPTMAKAGIDLLGELIGTATGLPPDSSKNKYHYLYGQPRRD